MYLWLCWVCIAVRGLSLVAVSGASLVGEHGSRVPGLSSCGTWASLSHGMWNLPGPGIKPVSPAFAGRFLSTAPTGKSSPFFLHLFFLLFFFFKSMKSTSTTGGPKDSLTPWLMLDPVSNPASSLKRGQMIHKYLK